MCGGENMIIRSDGRNKSNITSYPQLTSNQEYKMQIILINHKGHHDGQS